MNTALLDILVCPYCRAQVRRVDSALVCVTCTQESPIRDGVPQMLVEEGLVAKTKGNFQSQWSRRINGRAERRNVVYGYDIEKFMRWFDETFVAESLLGLSAFWAIDIGCGTAEKARALALRYPQCHVVAVDQVEAIHEVARENADVQNLHFVQANVWHLPFKAESFGFVMSIGVLHHTPDTHRAFTAIAPLPAPNGRLVTWLYPLPEEDSFWAGLYVQRDRHFMGLGHRLPQSLVLWWCRWYVLLGFRRIVTFIMKEYRANRQQMPIYPDTRPTRRDLYESLVFLTFDNVSPAHQYRHGREEVVSWYQEHGFSDFDTRFAGFFSGTKRRCLLNE